MDVSFGTLFDDLKKHQVEGAEDELDELGLLDGELSMLKCLLDKACGKYLNGEKLDGWMTEISNAVKEIHNTISGSSPPDKTPAEKVRYLRLNQVKPLFDMFKDKFSTVVTPHVPDTIAAEQEIAPNALDTMAAADAPDTIATYHDALDTMAADAPDTIAADQAIAPDEPDTVVNALSMVVTDPLSKWQEVPVVIERNIVGFEDEKTKLIHYLREERDELDVITVVGMPGLGKTTLAAMIFRNLDHENEFPTRIWVNISQEFNTRNVFLQILSKLIPHIDDHKQKSVQELAKTVANLLSKQQFLIVMDDVWTCEDWDKLKICLPSTGKVLVTSRQLDVASYASRLREPHIMRLLTENESMGLLHKVEGFGHHEFPEEWKEVENRILKECGGLPLAIVVIGGILFRKFSREEPGARNREQEKVSKGVYAYLTSEDGSNTLETIIALSYDKLPYHLKACFLYFGVFPEDCEIPARKLTRMWLAEGFVQQEDGLSYEETAERYLDQLINQSLIHREKVGRDGKLKTCRIHNILRGFCIAEGENEKSLQHRQCVHSNILNFLSSIPPGPAVRSFVSFSGEVVKPRKQYASAIPSAYKLLRVLESKPIIFPLIPSNMFQLVHLRYVTLSLATVDTLPRAFSKLSNLQTLIVYTESHALFVKADIWEMTQLRHFKTNASATLTRKAKRTSETQLQTLGGVSPKSCTEEVIRKICNVKNLSICGALSQGSRNVSFNDLSTLHKLEKLKLIQSGMRLRSRDKFPAQGELPGLPPAEQFPPNLKSLTLSGTSLSWEHMSILSQLGKLEVLVLKENAFMGEIWNSVDRDFQALEVLHIQRTDLRIWTITGHPFPRLRQLELKSCEKLEMIPTELAEIPTFQVLDLDRCPSAESSAIKIKERKDEAGQGANQYDNEFRLSIIKR